MNEVYTVPPVPGTQLSKIEAGYVDKGPFGCLNCQWLQGTNCRVVGGQVDSHGCCDYWNEAQAPHNVGKDGSEYVFVPGSNYTCAECRFFNPYMGNCWPVEGSISPGGSCNKWMPFGIIDTSLIEAYLGHSTLIRQIFVNILRENTPEIGKQGHPVPDPKPGDCIECGKPFNEHLPTHAPGGHHFNTMPNLAPIGITSHGPDANSLPGLHHAPGANSE